MGTERQVLENNGYAWKEFKTDSPVIKRRYYTPDGRAMVLPADSYSLEHYLKLGFSLTPPDNPLPPVEEPQTVTVVTVEEKTDALTCPECGKEAKDHVGLAIHRRKAHHPKKH